MLLCYLLPFTKGEDITEGRAAQNIWDEEAGIFV